MGLYLVLWAKVHRGLTNPLPLKLEVRDLWTKFAFLNERTPGRGEISLGELKAPVERRRILCEELIIPLRELKESENITCSLVKR